MADHDRRQTVFGSGFAYAASHADVNVFHGRGPLYMLTEYRSRREQDPTQASSPPSRLLDARYEIVPFVGREEELGRLVEWRDGPAGLSVRWLHAPGGQGKTRLGAAFAGLSGQAGWKVVTAVHGSATVLRSSERHEDLSSAGHTGLLVLVDYADRWPLSHLTVLFSNRMFQQAPCRVLLLARTAQPWPAVRAALTGLAITAETGSQRLSPHHEARSEREYMFAAARDAFAARYQVDPARIGFPDLSHSDFGLTLAVHMAALVAVDASVRREPSPTGLAGLSAYLLDRERRHWAVLYAGGAEGLSFRTPPEVMSRTVVTSVLTGPLRYEVAAEILRRVGAGEAAALQDHTVCYPPFDEETVLEPLRPDRLAEDFLALALPGHDIDGHPPDPWAADAVGRLIGLTLGTELVGAFGVQGEIERVRRERADLPGPDFHLHSDLDSWSLPYVPESPWQRSAMTILVETAARWPHVARGCLYPLLLARPDLPVRAGGMVLGALADFPDLDPGLLARIAARLPHGRHADLDHAMAAVSQRLHDHLLTQDPDDTTKAGSYRMLSVRRSGAGQPARAHEAAQTAVALRRRLVQEQPVDAARQAALADDLCLLADTLRAGGRADEALAAVEESLSWHQRMPSPRLPVRLWLQHPPWRPVLSDGDAAQARALITRSVILADLGEYDEALDSASTAATLQWRRMTAMTGRRAVRRWRREGTAPIEPGLAHVLASLAGRLSELGRHEEALAPALQACTAYRHLAAMRPGEFLDRLAEALNQVADLLRLTGRAAEATAAAEEHLDLLRRMFARDAAARLPLAMALVNLASVHYTETRRWDDALRVTDEAIGLCDDAPGVRSAWLLEISAAALGNSASYLRALGLWDEAGTRLERAAELYAELVAAGYEEFRDDLIDLTENLASPADAPEFLLEHGDETLAYALRVAAAVSDPAHGREVADRWAEVMRMFDDMVAHERKVGGGSLASALSVQATLRSTSGDHAAALAPGAEAIAIYRRLAARDTSVLPHLALGFHGHSVDLSAAGRKSEAMDIAREAVALYRQLGDDHRPGLANALNNLSIRLAEAERWDEALLAAEEAVEPGAVSDDLAEIERAGRLSDLARILLHSHRPAEALDRVEQAIAICHQHRQDHPEMTWRLLRTANGAKVAILETLGASREAADLRQMLTIEENRHALAMTAKTRRLRLRERLYVWLTTPK
ncbi:hypothetical protein [Streptosporangium sp. LJ11]|uniref:hypothetical protein n=1 Tax=Streptosporangium sp. LJ11 TaxID=3436927 RepID=UPI003F7AAD52